MNRTILNTFFSVALLLISGFAFGQDQKATDDKILADYFAKNKITDRKSVV